MWTAIILLLFLSFYHVSFQITYSYKTGSRKVFFYIRPLFYSIIKRKKYYRYFKLNRDKKGNITGFTKISN